MFVTRRLCLSPAQTASHKKPRPFPKGLVVAGQHVFEYDSLYIRATNSHGVGTHFAKVLDPFGDPLEVIWYDAPDKPEYTAKKHLKLAPQIGDTITVDGKDFTVVSFCEQGCNLKENGKKRKKCTKKKTTKKSKKRNKNTSPKKKPRLSPKRRAALRRKTDGSALEVATPAATGKKTEQANAPAAAAAAAAAEKNVNQDKPLAAVAAIKSRRRRKQVSRKAKAVQTQDPGKDADADPDAETAGWLRCRAPKLSEKARQTLEEALSTADISRQTLEDWSAESYYNFAERTMREYTKLQKSDMHLNYNNVFKAAIAQALDQVRPKECLPHDGNKKEALETLLPILVKVSNDFYRC